MIIFFEKKILIGVFSYISSFSLSLMIMKIKKKINIVKLYKMSDLKE